MLKRVVLFLLANLAALEKLARIFDFVGRPEGRDDAVHRDSQKTEMSVQVVPA